MSTSLAKVTTDCSSLKIFNLFNLSLISAAFSKSNFVTALSISSFNLSTVSESVDDRYDFALAISSK